MKIRGRHCATALLLVVLTGCAASSAEDGQHAITQPKTVDVPWSDYAPSVRTTIDSLAASKDCAGLQKQFDTADANSDATTARTGHSNAKLMEYIDAALKTAGCY